MTNNFTTYVLTLLSSFMIYWMFGTMMTASAGPVNSIPVISFWASVLQFGVGSWVFLHSVKIGRSICIVLGLLTILWPLTVVPWLFKEAEVWGFLFYGLPITLTTVVLYAHIRKFNEPERPGKITRVILSVVPFGLMITYMIYLFRLGYFG